MTMEIGEGVIGLGVSEAEFEIRNTWEAPGGSILCRELGGDPEFEYFRLALKLVAVFALVDGREPGNVHLPAIVILTDTLGEKVASLCDLENLISRLDLGPLLVP